MAFGLTCMTVVFSGVRTREMEEKGRSHSIGWLELEQEAKRWLVVGLHCPLENNGKQ